MNTVYLLRGIRAAVVVVALLIPSVWVIASAQSFEAIAVVSRVDSPTRTIVVGGREYRLAEDLTIHAQEAQRYQESLVLLRGRQVGFVDSYQGQDRPSLITEIWVIE